MNNEVFSAIWKTAPVPIPDNEIAHEYSAEVIVVGLGNAGTPAVRAAAESMSCP